jgi:chromosome segregation ATPase
MNKKIKLLLNLLPLILLVWGCQAFNPWPTTVTFKPDAAEERSKTADVPKRFQEGGSQNQTVVESAMDLSAKYAKLSDEASALREKAQTLTAENNRLKEQLTDTETRLQKAQKELTEATDLLVQMRIELNNWKVDILGFRNEMRDAQKTQLEAMLKILNALGAEVKTESVDANNPHVDSNTAPPNEPNQPKPPQISGEPNV